jgi:Bifunctional DNA primase/polymerase, N-terminal
MSAALIALRQQLLHAGIHVLPLYGKAPSMLKNWQQKFDTDDAEVVMWDKMWPDAINTGALCRHMPTLDVDVLNPEAAEAVRDLIKERFEERGHVPVRTGKAPKFAIPFRTENPFDKIIVKLRAPDGTSAQIEFLADGQQVVLYGRHPETGREYVWNGGQLGEITRDELADISQAEAQTLAADVVKLLIDQHGYTSIAPVGGKANGQDHGGSPDWGPLVANLIDHDNLTTLAAKVVIAGMAELPAIRLLRALVMAVPEPIDPARRTRRLDEVPGMVSSALAKFVHPAEPLQALEPGAPAARAFGFPWSLNWQGDAAMTDTRPCLV